MFLKVSSVWHAQLSSSTGGKKQDTLTLLMVKSRASRHLRSEELANLQSNVKRSKFTPISKQFKMSVHQVQESWLRLQNVQRNRSLSRLCQATWSGSPGRECPSTWIAKRLEERLSIASTTMSASNLTSVIHSKSTSTFCLVECSKQSTVSLKMRKPANRRSKWPARCSRSTMESQGAPLQTEEILKEKRRGSLWLARPLTGSKSG